MKKYLYKFSSLHPNRCARRVYFVLTGDVLSFSFHVLLDLRMLYTYIYIYLYSREAHELGSDGSLESTHNNHEHTHEMGEASEF